MEDKVIVIREAKKNDLAAIQTMLEKLNKSDSLYDPFWSPTWPYEEDAVEYLLEHLSSNSEKIVFIAEVGIQPVGYLLGEISEFEPIRPIKMSELCHLFVEENFRRHGVGKLLFKKFKEWSIKQNAIRMKVDVYAGNVNAVNFYERKGFQVDSVLLELDLQSRQ